MEGNYAKFYGRLAPIKESERRFKKMGRNLTHTLPHIEKKNTFCKKLLFEINETKNINIKLKNLI